MGGKAFGFEAKRMSRDEFKFISMFNMYNIQVEQVRHVKAKVVISVANKEDFGDIDILVSNEYFNFDTFWSINKQHYKEYKKNGGVISILDLSDRQIDLILTPPELFNIHYNYLAYNDMGNFIGRIAKSLNLKYGHDGLSLIVRYKGDITRKIGVIPTSTDVRYIYDLLDIPYRPYEGYDTMEQIYSDIMSSKYYHKDSFLLEKQSHHARVRDRKRKSYHGMLNYIKENDKSDKPRRSYSIEETLSILPSFVTEEYIKITAEYDKKMCEKTLYNGNIVSNVTGLKGKDLGAFMASIKDKIDIYGDVKEQIIESFSDYK